ncbi:protein of unknown function DUF985 [Syntrophobacter fumaroxidans MPOB]|uniref:DUF985 domain-containing protein n=1 Tax=Syntrophobacter fumaroxidans (strain DSM 10017 / MPOB) TaxID=335543 RepID=A0LLZ5_SYNFM|nr:protein of unknown function DUF985 [Syntrophobacter fumaroxidans MPOB]
MTKLAWTRVDSRFDLPNRGTERVFEVKDAAYWIKKLGLSVHPEGGYFVQTFKSAEMIQGAGLPDRYGGPRAFASFIYYLLESNDFSCLHRLKSDEVWHYYAGSSLTLFIIDERGNLLQKKLGNDPEKGQSFQVFIRHGHWFGAIVDDSGSFTLAGCTVAPGFEYEDFKLGNRRELVELFPEHRFIIERLTR